MQMKGGFIRINLLFWKRDFEDFSDDGAFPYKTFINKWKGNCKYYQGERC